MKILLTGGAGDLGKVLTLDLMKRKDTVLRFDIAQPSDQQGTFVSGSILDTQKLLDTLPGVDCIVHIAAWHGYHEFTKQKNCYDFWDLNVTGTFNVFQAALECNVRNVIFISSEAVSDITSYYGWTKVLGEDVAQYYMQKKQLNILTLRPRAFIPYWNKAVYHSFIEWAKWFWNGAVHINDVAQAVVQGIDLLSQNTLSKHLILPVDGAYEYTQNDLENWDNSGPGTTFKKYYADYFDLAVQYGLNPMIKPTVQNIEETKKWLGYQPHYSLKNLLSDLKNYSETGFV